MKRFTLWYVFLTLACCLISCSKPVSTSPETVAFPAIDGNAVLQHTKILASDEFEGRAPGTPGEERSINYIVEQFQKAGLKP